MRRFFCFVLISFFYSKYVIFSLLNIFFSDKFKNNVCISYFGDNIRSTYTSAEKLSISPIFFFKSDMMVVNMAVGGGVGGVPLSPSFLGFYFL